MWIVRLACLAVLQGCITAPSVTVTIRGEGTVETSTHRICDDDCGMLLEPGTELVATPDDGWTFAGWDVPGCSGDGACAPDVADGDELVVTFDPIGKATYSFDVTIIGGIGSVQSTPRGIFCVVPELERATSLCSGTYAAGEQLALTVMPSSIGSGYRMRQWSGSEVCEGASTTCEFIFDRDVSLIVELEAK